MAIDDFFDDIGEAYMQVSPEVRRSTGAVYTPLSLVRSMVEWASEIGPFDRVVDPGCGSGRFALACAEAFPQAVVYAIDVDEYALEMTRENAKRLHVTNIVCINDDFTRCRLPECGGRTLWIGNPPYVRHHGIPAAQKQWFQNATEQLGVSSSGLAGMHAYFLARIALDWKDGDAGCLVLPAEWLDNGYGSSMRELFATKLNLSKLRDVARLGGAFGDTLTSTLVAFFGDGTGEVRLTQDDKAGDDRVVPLKELASSSRWSDVFWGRRSAEGLVPLSSIARVHRGVVTGCNSFWVRPREAFSDVPAEWLVPVVSHARQLYGDDPDCLHPERLDVLLSLPAEAEGSLLLQEACRIGVDAGYVASHRNPWWMIAPSPPPDILMTYMARRTPTFVVNAAKVSMLNVVHGVYLNASLSKTGIARLAQWLNRTVDTRFGRIYAGGLAKFEPSEAERVAVPPVAALEDDEEWNSLCQRVGIRRCWPQPPKTCAGSI